MLVLAIPQPAPLWTHHGPFLSQRGHLITGLSRRVTTARCPRSAEAVFKLMPTLQPAEMPNKITPQERVKKIAEKRQYAGEIPVARPRERPTTFAVGLFRHNLARLERPVFQLVRDHKI